MRPMMLFSEHVAELGAGLEAVLRRVPGELAYRVHWGFTKTVVPAWRLGPRTIDDQFLVLVRHGRGTYRIAGRELAYGPGDIIYITRQVPHEACPDARRPPTFTVLRFGIYDAAGRPQDTQMPAGWVMIRAADAFDDMVRASEAATRAAGRERVGALPFFVSRAYVQVLMSLLHGVLAGRPESGPPAIEAARAHMEHFPLEAAPIAALARQAQLSPRYFGILFRRHTGTSPKQYQLKVRMRYAEAMLRERLVSVKQCALQLGYADPFCFSRQFGRTMGYPPSHCQRVG